MSRTRTSRRRATSPTATRDTIGLIKALLSEAAFHIGTGAWKPARGGGDAAWRSPTTAQLAGGGGRADDPRPHRLLDGRLGGIARSAIVAPRVRAARANPQHRGVGHLQGGARGACISASSTRRSRSTRAMTMLVGQSQDPRRRSCAAACWRPALARWRVARGWRSWRRMHRRHRIGSRSRPGVHNHRRFGRPGRRLPRARARREIRPPSRPRASRSPISSRLARAFPIAAPAAAIARALSSPYGRGQGGGQERGSPARGLAPRDATAECPDDQAIAHATLAEAGEHDHAARAHVLFGELGCGWHVASRVS